MLGFNQSAMSQYLNAKIPLNVSAATRFATLIGCSVAEFSPALAAQVAQYASAATVFEVAEPSTPYLAQSTKVRVGAPGENNYPVKLVSIRVNAGFPGFESDQIFEDGGAVSVPQSVIEANDWVPQCLLAIKVRGRSMEPMFYDGDKAVVNIADTRPVSGHIYAINYDGSPVVKQLIREGPNWYMYSFNRDPEFGKRIFRSPESIIVARVVWQPGRALA